MRRGLFEKSALFNNDPAATNQEVARSGWVVNQWLSREGESDVSACLDPVFLALIHRRWFETTFPRVAGYIRRVKPVSNRKSTAWHPSKVEGGVREACADWEYAIANHSAPDYFQEMLFAVQQANRLRVRIYDIHPFLDGNTRATWSTLTQGVVATPGYW